MALKNIHRRSDSHLHHARAPQLIPVPSNPRDADDDPVVTPTTQPTTPTSTFTRGQISIPTGPPPPLTTPSSVSSAPTASATSITSLQDLITSLSSTQQQQVEEEEADAETTPPAERSSRSNNEQLTASRETQSRVTVSQTRSGSLPSSTSAEPEDEGMGMGSIIGMAVAGVAGIAVISAFIVWMIRRRRRQKEYADIDASPFNNDPTPVTRNSTFVVDEPVTHARPQPEMIDRSYTPTPSYGGGFNNAPMNNNAFGYSTQPSYGPGQVIFSPTSAGSFGPGGSPATPLPYNPGYEAQRPGGYAELSRGGPPSPLPFTPNPFENQQQLPPVPPPAPSGTPAPTGEPQYPALSAAPAPAHGQVVDVPASAHENNAAPVQHGYIPPPAALQPGQRKPANRPDTVYDPEDAYGGM